MVENSSRRIIFDSNIWVALFHKDDSQHLRAGRLVDEYTGRAKIVLTEYLLTEICSILKFNAGQTALFKFVKEVVQNPEAEIIYSTPDLFAATLKLFEESANEKLSFIDTSLLIWSKIYKVETFDKDLSKTIRDF